MMLNEGRWGGGTFIKPETLRRFLSRQGEQGRRLGWDVPTPGGSTGRYFSTATFGHLGYTGASHWIDPENDFFVALLNNRVYPTRANKKILQFRPRIHDAVVDTFRGNG